MHHTLKMELWDSPGNLLESRRVRRELPELTRQLGILLRSGERLDRALATLAEFAQARQLRRAILAARDDVRAGTPLSTSLRRHPELFSDFYTGVIALGEAGGDLAGAVQRVADHLFRQRQFAQSLTTAVSYPLLLLVITGLSLLVLLIYVLPQFRDLFEDAGVQLPWGTQVLLGLSEMLRAYGWVIVLVVAALVVACRASLQRIDIRHRWHRFQLQIPLVSDLVSRLDVARFSSSLGEALSGGVPLLDALRLSRASVANLYLRRSLDAAIDTIKDGGRLADGLRPNQAFPLLATHMIQVGEDSGRLVESLRDVAEVYNNEFDTAVKRLLNILEPVLIILIGSGIALVILTMISAIQRLNAYPI